MKKKLCLFFLFFCCLFLTVKSEVYAIIAPVKVMPDKTVELFSCDEIKLKFEQLDLYHHPIGVWIAEYCVVLENTRILPLTQNVGFPSGFDVRMIEKDLYCDRFYNFKLLINNSPQKNIKFLTKCINYIEATGAKWTMDDGSGVGFLNTWEMDFKPEEKKEVKITFCINVNKLPINFNPSVKETWYTSTMEWIKTEYANREQADFSLPLSLGSFWAFYPDSIVIRTFLATDWLKVVEKSNRKYEDYWITRYEYGEPYGFFSPPAVELIAPSDQELQKMTNVELNLLKNSFLAKYGKKFNSTAMNLFFSHQPWYFENVRFHAWLLTDWDAEVFKLVNEFELKVR